jgi:hypothetical protein
MPSGARQALFTGLSEFRAAADGSGTTGSAASFSMPA